MGVSLYPEQASSVGVAQPTAVSAPLIAGADLPNFKRDEVTAAEPDLNLIRDLLMGTRRMWEQSAVVPYIRKWNDELDSVYDVRRKSETLFEGLSRTVSAGVGMLFAKPPQIDWKAAETAFADDWKNLDGAGTSGPVLVKRYSEMVIRDGFAVILVDHPQPPTKPDGTPVETSAATDAPMGLRPTWAIYPRCRVINWRTDKINNQTVPTLVVLTETAELPSGEFGIKKVERYRVLRLIATPEGWQASFKLYQLNGDAGKRENYQVAGEGVFRNQKGEIADALPLSVGYSGRTDAPFCSSIPLMGVAWANLAHWQQSTNLRFYRDLSAFPQPVLVGELAADPITADKGKLRLGPLVLVHVQGDPGSRAASFSWAEIEGKSMEQIAAGVAEKLQQMSQLGMSFLVADTRAAETAEAKRLDSVAENSTLGTAAQGIDDGVNGALRWHAWYKGIEADAAPTLAVNRDFESTAMDAATMTAYVQAVSQAGLPPRVMLEAWKAAGRIPPDTDIDAVIAEIEGNIAAQAEQARNEAAAAAAAGAKGAKPTGGGNAMQIEYGANGRPSRLVPSAAAAA